MPALNVNQKQLEEATYLVYGEDGEHAPTNVWIDHFDEGWSFVRATFPSEFCGRCATRLMKLREVLQGLSANAATVTICVYMGDTAKTLPEDRQAFVRNRLAGIKPRRP